MSDNNQSGTQFEVAAIVTAMTDAEKPFVRDTIESILSDLAIGQIVLCIEENNNWIDATLNSLVSDPRLEVIRLPLVPLGAVRNKALNHVRMPWVAYCDGDDVWCNGKTLIQLNHAKATGCDFVGADHYLTNEKGEIRALAPARYIPMPSSWMVKTEIMKQHPFTEAPFSLSQEESGEWWSRTSGIVSKARCPKMLLRYRIRSNSLSNKTPSMQRKAKIVSLANIPVLGTIILLVTWLNWLFTRQDQYIWYTGWGEQSSSLNR
ncbi:glycosyltransferase [Pseudanabaena yagii]|uniref:Glycosyltransferase n=1 Tax=Pseudanabaena yagii GIHE-NHR1 TaxID=2722753 RepID=A0ABX1LYF4_9CYAN|nr:glycosyltransferase [Pseudanabaena yagii]NMF60550.1 glycosyltransferase [Pseudanabaena yagii GIHE-NHR1]